MWRFSNIFDPWFLGVYIVVAFFFPLPRAPPPPHRCFFHFRRNLTFSRGVVGDSGANLRKTNDPALLKKAIKRKAKKKSSSAKAWNSRVEKVKDSVAERQRIRGHNLDQRKLGGATAANLSSKRIVEKDAGEGDGGGGGGKGEKRKRMGPHSNQGGNRAGFEGKKSGFINGDGGGGGEGRGGGASSAAPGGAGKKGR